MLFIIVGGVVSALHLAVQNFPAFEPRTVRVSVRLPGASPKEVEEDIIRRVEEAVRGLSGVERVVSTATHGGGRVKVELADFADADTVLADVGRAVDAIEDFPAQVAEQPEVELFQLPRKVMTLAVSSSRVGDDELRQAAEDLRDGLLRLPSLSQVVLEGTREREISIELSEEVLRRNDLSISEVARAVRRASLNLTSGELRTEAGGVVLHTVAKRRLGKEFEDIALITRLDGTIVTLGDVAQVRDAFVDEDILSEFNGKPAVFVRIDAAQEQSIVDIADEVRSWLATWPAPQDVDVGIWNDRGCWYLVRALHKRPARARYRALSRHLLGAYGALRDQLGPASALLLEAVEAVLHQRHRASSAIEGFNATLRPYLYVHQGATQGFLALFRAWFNLRTRRWGRHKGTSAHECLTGQRVHDWLTLLGYPPSPTLH